MKYIPSPTIQAELVRHGLENLCAGVDLDEKELDSLVQEYASHPCHRHETDQERLDRAAYFMIWRDYGVPSPDSGGASATESVTAKRITVMHEALREMVREHMPKIAAASADTCASALRQEQCVAEMREETVSGISGIASEVDEGCDSLVSAIDRLTLAQTLSEANWQKRWKALVKTTIWYGTLGLVALFGLLFILCCVTLKAHAQIDVIKFQANDGSAVGTVAAPFTFKAGSNCSFAKSGSTFTVNCTGGAAAAGGSSGQVQWNNAGALAGISTLTTTGTINTALSGADWLFADPTAPTKKAQFDLSNITAANTRTINVPDANSTLAQASTCTNQVFTSMSGQGVFACSTITSAFTSGTFSPSAHNLLSSSHGDTTAGTVARGDLITGQGASATWSRLAKGTAGQCLQMDGTATDIIWGACGAGGGSGTVTSFSAGNLSPIFTTSVATATTTPTLSFSLSNAAAHTFFGNNTGVSAAPAFSSIGNGDLPGSGAVTVNTSSPLGGGGSVSLGNSLTLTCSTCLTSVTAHNLLSATHGDTTAHTVVRGDIIAGIGASPSWTAVAKGGTNTYPKWNSSGDVVASTNPASGTGACATHNFETTDNADAAPTCAQPAFSDISGTATTGQLPAATVYNNQANTYSGGGLQDLHAMKMIPPTSTVAGLPTASTNTNEVYEVTDGLSSSDCTSGAGTTQVWCVSNGTSWVTLGDGGGAGGGVSSVSGTANQITSTGGANPVIALANPLTFPGKATLAASTTGAASLNVPSGTVPTSPTAGDVARDSGGFHLYDDTTGTVNLLISGPSTNAIGTCPSSQWAISANANLPEVCANGGSWSGMWYFVGSSTLGANASTISVTASPAYKHYLVRLIIIGYSGSGVARAEFGNTSTVDTGATYSFGGFNIASGTSTAPTVSGIGSGSTAQEGVPVSGSTTTAGRFVQLQISNSGTNIKYFTIETSGVGTSAAVTPNLAQIAGLWNNTTNGVGVIQFKACTATTGTCTTTNLLTGTSLTVWGRNDN